MPCGHVATTKCYENLLKEQKNVIWYLKKQLLLSSQHQHETLRLLR